MDERIGIVGVNSRAVAYSAKRLDYTVYLVDYFRDVDVEADFHYSLQNNPLEPCLGTEYSPDRLADLAIDKLDGKVDSLLITSDLGCNPRLVRGLGKYFNIMGNGWEQIARAKDWKVLKSIFDDLGIFYPKTAVAGSFRGLQKIVEGASLPVVVKSLVKGTGFAPTLVECPEDIEVFRDVEFNVDVLVQEYVSGEAISSSVLSDGREATTLSVNKQLIGVRGFGARGDFVYCGNIVPLDPLEGDKILGLSSELISRLKLVGSNGIDYILSDDGRFYFMEVNTRFQDTLECVEKYRGINLVEEHLSAVGGDLRLPCGRSGLCYGKGILYADRTLRVGDLRGVCYVGDVPFPGARILEGEPVCSVYSCGADSNVVFSDLLSKSKAAGEGFVY